MTTLEALLAGIVADPDPTRWLVLADWLEEYDDPRRAELIRLHQLLRATCCEPDKHPKRAAWQKGINELLREGVRPCVSRQTLVLDGVEMDFHFIPPGSFLMGSFYGEADRKDNEHQHRVTLTRGFFMGVYPVTQSQWAAVMGKNPSSFKGKDRPVEMVSWADCQEFCRQLHGLVRLPTEAEWEFACRAGTTTPFHVGNELATDQANYNRRRLGIHPAETTPVGSFPPNAWGLFDMHGNVWEWCADNFGHYPTEDTNDPQISNGRIARVQRGGSWDADLGSCRSAHRGWVDANYRDADGGFRLCLD